MPENNENEVVVTPDVTVNATPTPVPTDLPTDYTTVDHTYHTDPDITGVVDEVESHVLAGLAPSVTMTSEAALSEDYPQDNDGDEENYIHSAPYFGRATKSSHDLDNLGNIVYDHDYNPEAPQYGVYVNGTFTETATMLAGDAKRFEIRARGTQTTPSEEEGGEPTVAAVDSWTDDIPGMIWVSQNEEIAIIREGNQVYALKPGTVTIEIYNTNENAFVAELVITVVKATSENNEFTITV